MWSPAEDEALVALIYGHQDNWLSFVAASPQLCGRSLGACWRRSRQLIPAPEPTAEPVDTVNYGSFLDRKSQGGAMSGFAPVWVPGFLFDFQKSLVDWAIHKGRAAILADCGLGKGPMALVWAENVVRKTMRPVLILTPLAVAGQFLREGAKFDIPIARSYAGEISSTIVVCNYERLHYFNPADFGGVVCDESSRIKHFSGATQAEVTRFLLKVPYRLLCTATAAPNDYIELGTSSQALGELGYSEMLSRFFKQSDNKMHRLQQIKDQRREKLNNHFGKLSFRVSQQIGQWHLKSHAATPFWQWIASWARACRKPSDLGFPDGAFILPELIERAHSVMPDRPPDGMLLTLPAIGLNEEREERRRTLTERCELVARLVDHDRQAIIWCHLNVEGDRLAQMIPNSRQAAGANTDEEKEEILTAFANGELQRLIIKPKIGAWGLNLQNCAHVVTFASHSYEQYYQSVRRCWRFGQKSPVTVDIIATEGERRVQENMARKAAAADHMFAELVAHMNGATDIKRETPNHRMTLPAWL